MGSFVFKWEHPADEVYVTGTFDEWSKSERLNKTEVNFSKRVILPDISQKIYYKFVVDGNWISDHTAPQEEDESGNLNNVLTVDQITRLAPEMANTISGVFPTSTTAIMAGAVPLEKDKSKGSPSLPEASPGVASIVSGVTPNSTTVVMAGAVSLEKDKSKDSYRLPEISPGSAIIISGITPDSTTATMAGTVPLEKTQIGDKESTAIFKNSLQLEANISGVVPDSTTVKMAGAVPLEKKKKKESSGLPGSFPGVASSISGVTPNSTTATLAGRVPLENNQTKEKEYNTNLENFSQSKAIISGVVPNSTTAIMAGAVPLEEDKKKESSGLPGTFPGAEGSISRVFADTPAVIAENVPRKERSAALPGTFPETPGATERIASEFAMNPPPRIDEDFNPTSILPGQGFHDHVTKTHQTCVGKDLDLNATESSHEDVNSPILPSQDDRDELSEQQNTLSTPVLLDETNKRHQNVENQANSLIASSFITKQNKSENLTMPSNLQSTTNKINSLTSELLSSPQKNTETDNSVGMTDSFHEAKEKNTIENEVTNISRPARDLINLNGENSKSSSEETGGVSGTSEAVIKPSTTTPDILPVVTNVQKEVLEEVSEPNSRLQNSAGKISPSASSSSIPSRGVSPHTVPTAKVTTAEPWAQSSQIATECTATHNLPIPADAVAVAGTTSPASLEKTEKKKKRTSIFGKLKAKLTHKDKD